VAISPDGRHAYVIDWYGGLAVLRRKRDGWLTQLAGEAGCIQRAFGWQLSDCARARALNGSRAVAVSPDGAFVYVAAYSSDAIAAFRRDPATGALTQPPGATGCVMLSGKYAGGRARPLRRPLDLAVSPDGRRL
jgi:DNA-binding beta-propeller fold protein YncE